MNYMVKDGLKMRCKMTKLFVYSSWRLNLFWGSQPPLSFLKQQ